MMKYNTLLRSYGVLCKRLPIQRYSSTKSNSPSSSSTSSSSDDEKNREVKKSKRSEEALEKLNQLLNSVIEEHANAKKQSQLELAKPKNRKEKDVRSEPGTESVKSEPIEKQAVKAVKEVAEAIGGDVKQTESELLQKLLNPVKEESIQTSTPSLSEIFKDMKIDREPKLSEDVSRAQQVRQLLKTVKPTRRQPLTRTTPVKRGAKIEQEDQVIEERVTLFRDKSLGIFPTIEEMQNWPEQKQNKTWRALHERELRLAVTHLPANYFQHMILWTEQGKLWKFPIDNEQGLDAEKAIYFTEHVFLDKHLEPWCPPKGPIRHFMELVCVGLSKNPYLSVEEKKEHINWFKDYFNEKKQILKEVGAIPPGFDTESKKIEA